MRDPHDTALPPSQPATPPVSSPVLIVDDSADIRLFIEALLARRGYQTELAASGAEALERLHASRISLVIMDWMMPQMDGLEVCRRVRKEISERYVYLILVTAKDTRLDNLAGMAAGADDFLVKPIDPELLFVRLRAGERVIALEQQLREQNAALRQAVDAQQRAHARQERELKLAGEVQRALLPQPGVTGDGVRIAWLYEPAKYLGGDLLNVFPIREGVLGLYAIDVAGHGIDAALMSFRLHHMLRVESALGVSEPHSRLEHPAELVAWLNTAFIDEALRAKYFTMIYATFDYRNHQFRFCQAGHPHPILLGRDGGVRVLGSGGFPVGLLDMATFADHVITVEPGDRLVIRSDGLDDCQSPSGERLGAERIQAWLTANADLGIDDLFTQLRARLHDWTHGTVPQSDDLSVLGIEFDQPPRQP